MLCCLCLSSCENKDYYKIDMNTDYKDTSNLEDGNGNKTKVVLLLGQSNASGCSFNDYLQKNISEEEYQKFENGFENIYSWNYVTQDVNLGSRTESYKVYTTNTPVSLTDFPYIVEIQ